VGRAAALAVEQLKEQGSPWLTRTEAATYCRLSLSRMEKDRTIPHRKLEGRVIYHRGELDAWLDQFRAAA
jgi:hypothetical protein